ncbi:FtsX-like permease family protein [Dactylosporangium sp. AC04546]|uniref:FtsX-like permease family protein n=1 Tax=Dactylosporangium sp. AC04546 TaxID=2862460 RepID=UPI001EDD6B3D|nr:FtsX-like permease family protein [Dactylosporangium sp. AC04546]WVK85119.1 FtsX-like permease family protein [Dactylosporangium sp. AC04546]
MLALVLAALRARRAQALTLLVLSTLAAAAAAAAPWYVLASTERVATRHMETAPIQERSLETIGETKIEGGSITDIVAAQAELTQQVVGLDGFTVYTQAHVTGQSSTVPASSASEPRSTGSPLVMRTDACEHAVIEGRCATAAGEAMLSYRTARFLRLKAGDPIVFTSTNLNEPAQLTVVGVYRPDDPADPFWSSNSQLVAQSLPTSPPPEITEPVDDAVLVGAATLDAIKPKNVRTITDLIAQPALLVDHQPDVVRAYLDAATVDAANNRLTLTTSIYEVIKDIERDRQLVSLGVPVGAFQLLILCWFALYLAVKYTGEERRPDIGLVKLRGATRGRTWSLVGGQSGLPMLGGAVLGLPLGYLVATAVNGAIRDPAVRDQAFQLSLGAVALAVVGALLAALLAERRSLGASVAELLRQSPARAGAWRDLLDLVLVIIAVAALWQLRNRAEGDVAGLALLAPGLAALAFALVAARLITYGAGRLVEGALRHGRPARALSAIYLARRPGVHRLAALIIVTVALLCTSFLTWNAGQEAGRHRAELEVGADRVLTVRAENRLALLEAVRRADPGGKSAMAAVQSLSSGNDRVLLVDSPRLAAVAAWRPEYGLSAAQTAALLHPKAPDPVYVTGGQLTLDVTNHYTVPDRQRVVVLDVVMADPAGTRTVVRLGPLTEGQQRLTAPVPACTKAPGCRLSSLNIMQSTLEQKIFFASRPGIEVTVHGITQSGPDQTVVGRETLADRSRWRLDVNGVPPNLIVVPATDGLLLKVAPIRTGGATDPGVYPLDAPAPIMSVRARPLKPRLIGDQRVSYGTTALTETIGATAARLPRLGEQGVLVDLEYADRLAADFGAGESLQVWLARDAPPDLPDKLRKEGLIVLGEESIDSVAERYASFGPPLTLQFMLLSAIIGVALAAGATIIVAAVERRPRARELAALRHQGASARLVKRVSIEGYLVLVGVSVLLGLLLAALIHAYVGDVMPYFADGWSAP